MKRINVLCAMRDSRVVDALRRELGERCLLRAVSDGEAALSAALRMPPDILVVDAVLRQLDGAGIVQRLAAQLKGRMPLVIGGSVGRFADAQFARCGVKRCVRVPWDADELCAALCGMIEEIDTRIDWERAQPAYARAGCLLREMGMSSALRGFTYLAWAAALASDNEDRLYAVGERLYRPIAEREGATPQSVERLIRHAIERTADTVGERGIYAFFGNTIDPMRGKPTNAQMIAMLAQRLRLDAA